MFALLVVRKVTGLGFEGKNEPACHRDDRPESDCRVFLPAEGGEGWGRCVLNELYTRTILAAICLETDEISGPLRTCAEGGEVVVVMEEEEEEEEEKETSSFCCSII